QIGLKFLALFIIGVLIAGTVVMALWNAILPAVVGVKAITFLQALGILLLSRILFGGIGRRGGGWQGRRGQWRGNMKEKWAKMTSEEREKFKAEWGKRCEPHWQNKEEAKPGDAPVG
ncbi:MAG: hypothetical protein ABIN25_10650, partial [Ginsengibacter sp.]